MRAPANGEYCASSHLEMISVKLCDSSKRRVCELLAHVLLGEIGHRDVELVTHVPPQSPEHLLVEGMAVLLLHIAFSDPETLHGDLVGSLAAHQRRVLTTRGSACAAPRRPP